MKNRFLIFLLPFMFQTFMVSGQMKDLELSTQYNNSTKQLVIDAVKLSPGTFFLEINFQEFENTSFGQSQYTKTVKSSGTILTLDPLNNQKYVRSRYSFRYWRANPESNPDTSFVYRLPYSSTVGRTVNPMTLIGASYASRSNLNWHAEQFIMQPGDTVYAVRTGVAVKIRLAEPETTESHSTGRVNYRRNVNEVLIEHEDGTYADYSVLDTLLVSEGMRVYPDTPIGLAGSYDGERYQIRLLLYYMRIAPKGTYDTGTKFEYHYFRPVFATTQGEKKLVMQQEYRPVVTTELVTREMNRREARKYGVR